MMEIKIYMNVLILLGGIKTVVLGADDFTVEVSESCFNDNDAVRLVVQYTGSGSPTAVRWKYDKMTNAAATLDVVISFCAASAGADPAFPVARMSYNCDTTNKQYNVTISSFNESTDAGLWEAAISVSGSFSNFKSVTVEKCLFTTTDGRYNCTGMEDSEVIDTEEECICIWTFIGILLSLAVYIMSFMVVGCCLYFCEESCCCDVDDKLPSWMQKWWQKVIFVGILIVYLIWKRCTGNGDVEPREANPRHGLQRGNQPRELPPAPLGARSVHDRDPTAIINNDKHPLDDTVTPLQKAGTLKSLHEETVVEVQEKKKKKKKKKLQDDEV